MEVWNWFLAHYVEVLAVIGTFATIAAWTPNKSDDKIVQIVLDVINFVGMNFNKAKNDPKV